MNYYAENITGSEIIKISQKIKEAKHGVFNLSIGDFDPTINPIPNKLKDDIINAYEHCKTNYPAAAGELLLREKIVDKHYNFDEILIGAGARPLIYTLFKAIVNPGDKVIYPVPSWNNNHYCFLHDASSVEIECKPDNNFFPTSDDIANAVNKSTSLICICSPQNPTGKVIDPQTLKEICELIVNENKVRKNYKDLKPLYLFFDQIYSELAPGLFTHPLDVCLEIKPYLVCIDGVSKSLCATGIRVGWMKGPKELISKMTSIFSHIGAWAPKPEQLAVSTYLQTSDKTEFVNRMIEKYFTLSNLLCNFLEELKALGYKVDYIIPDGSIYISMYLGYSEKFKTIDDFVDYLINNGIGIVPFEYFGSKTNKGWFRISIGTLDINDIPDLCLTLQNTIKKLHEY